MKLLDLFREYKKKILFIFSLTIVENVAWIIEPWIFGKLIDEFILKANGSVFHLTRLNFYHSSYGYSFMQSTPELVLLEELMNLRYSRIFLQIL